MNLVTLDAAEHRDLRLRSLKPEPRSFVEIVASEFAAAAARCPIFFAKSPETGAFYAGAMFGFKEGENLCAPAGETAFLPLDARRAGFYISGDVIAIDADNARFTATDEGEPLFSADGEPAPALRAAQAALSRLSAGKDETEAFIASLLRLRLIEPIDISLRFDDGEKLVLQGLYTVSLDALRDLPDDDAIDMFRRGQLQLAYTVIQSTHQVSVLAERRNRRLAEG